MTQTPALMQLAMSAARHASVRQTTIASNVANADTPGYRARDVAAFAPDMDGLPLRRSNPLHFAGTARTDLIFEELGGPASQNGNTVSLEDQVLRGIDAQRSHNRAVTIYQASLDVLRSSLGRR